MRVGRWAVQRARKLHPLAPMLLRVCGGRVSGAVQEVKWIQQEIPQRDWRRACFRRGVLHEPLQYILGSQPFGELDIKCKPGVLIPRWETEEWCLRLCELIANAIPSSPQNPPLTVVDYCSGTGCVGLLLASRFQKSSQIFAIDKSDQAVALATLNKRDLGFKNVEILHGDALQDKVVGIEGAVDLVVSNPPYVRKLDRTVEKSVYLHEPHMALLGDLEFYKAIFAHANEFNAKALVMEVGTQHQIDFVQQLAADAQWMGSRGANDSAGKPRVVICWRTLDWAFLDNF